MDQIIVKELELFGFHGVNVEEKAMGQKFIVDLELGLDLSKACETDDLSYTINYAELCHKLQQEFQRSKHDLIEHAAHSLVMLILETYSQVQTVELTLKKPWAPIHLPVKYPAVKISRSRHRAYIAVGANLGDREGNIRNALEKITNSGHTKILRESELIETDPVGYLDQDRFLNGVFEVETLLTPASLMTFLMSIEAELKRERVIKWGPRTLDLDIIYYDDLITEDEQIILPHPRMHERLFVLEPLAEIAPNKLHPILKKRTTELVNIVKSF